MYTVSFTMDYSFVFGKNKNIVRLSFANWLKLKLSSVHTSRLPSASDVKPKIALMLGEGLSVRNWK